MKKLVLVGFGLFAVIIIVLGSQTNVVGYHSVKAYTESEYVEVTISPNGIRGFGNSTVKLTRTQYETFDQYLTNFQAKLNQTKTREETILLFKEAIVELNKFGLLPKHMSIRVAQDLVIGKSLRNPLNIIRDRRARSDHILNTNALLFSYGEYEERCNLLYLLIVLLSYGQHGYGPFNILFYLYVISQIKPFNFYCPVIMFNSGKIFSIGGEGVNISTGGYALWDFVGLSITTKLDGYDPEKMLCLGWSKEIEVA